ncbi:MAG: ribose-phosphate pyrophosphokinase [Bacteroidota bacterium]|nr:ribose-phosphate pyrophosphokinase [Bacteroidota bacterium]MDP3146122.1 ribose-phosphate pyrophosphokinase [Bacteroidota bacterium]
METIIFTLPGNEKLVERLLQKLKAEEGKVEIRQFPDTETYVRVLSDVKNKKVIIICTLHEPDEKLLPLYFLSKTIKSLGATAVCLIAPYLSYMRQDKVFKPGEGITSEYFASLISGFADSLITIDPHLHRRASMNEIYSIPSKVLHASKLISSYIKENIKNPLLIGPDAESEQWVSEVAKDAGAPFIVLKKIRKGDKDVEVSVPDVQNYLNHTPVLVDDIISTARTMIETVRHLKNAKMKAPTCIGVHAVFAGNAYEELKKSGAEKIITCNTIEHVSNEIDISDLLVKNIS